MVIEAADVLVVNAGSSSLKLSVLDEQDRAVFEREVALAEGADPSGQLVVALRDAPPVRVAGHRVVHGGPAFHAPVMIDADACAAIRDLADLAPLHNPPAIAAIDALRELAPDLAMVACFDTAFHATITPAASTYALPARWRSEWGIRRYGFHGLSHAYVSRRAAALVGRPVGALRVLSCHLGAGASLCAVDAGASVDTTMGYTPLDGLVMASRSGALDPGAVLAVQRQRGLSAAEAEHDLYHASGLLGLAGTADMREVIARLDQGDAAARLALDVYVHRLRTSMAAMVAAMGGVDVVAFTGGVGEHAAVVRERAAAGLGFLGVAVDDLANRRGTGDRDVSAAGAVVRTLVVHAREDVEIAAACRRLLAG